MFFVFCFVFLGGFEDAHGLSFCVFKAVNNPEVSSKKRMHKNVLKKESRKRKSQAFQ